MGRGGGGAGKGGCVRLMRWLSPNSFGRPIKAPEAATYRNRTHTHKHTTRGNEPMNQQPKTPSHTHTLSLSLVVYNTVQYKQWVHTHTLFDQTEVQKRISLTPEQMHWSTGDAVNSTQYTDKPGYSPALTNTYMHYLTRGKTDTVHNQQLVLWAHCNLGSPKSSLSISEHLGVTSH